MTKSFFGNYEGGRRKRLHSKEQCKCREIERTTAWRLQQSIPFFIFLDADTLKVWGANRIRDPGSLTPSNYGFSTLAFLAWVIANALNTPPVTLRWQHEIQRNCTAVYTNRVRMWFNRYNA